MVNKIYNERKRSLGIRKGFLSKAGRAGLILLALAGPVQNKANAEETRKPATLQDATEVGHYPNFSGAGVHGNPAVWPEYGDWAYISFSGSPNQENASVSAIVSSGLAEGVHGLLKIEAAGDSQKAEAKGQGVLALTLPYTLRLRAGFGADSNGKVDSQVGIASVAGRSRFLIRNGIDYGFPNSQIRAASEARVAFGRTELTGSGSVSVAATGGGLEYTGQALGAQVRYKSHLASFGCGGLQIREWDRFRLHYRLWAGKKTMVDLHLRGKGIGLFKNPDYVGVGVTKMF